MTKNLYAQERKKSILDILERDSRVEVADLVKKYGVTGSTIRNDLRELENDNLIIRTHGGAIKKEYSRNIETSPDLREFTNEKYDISKKAVELIVNNDILAIDTGTTCTTFAKQLVESDRKNLTILTYDLEIALLLNSREDYDVQILGGQLRSGYPYTWGNNIIQSMENFSVDKAFLATTSFDLKYGFSTPNSKTANLKTSLIKIAKETIMLCESIKIDNRSFSKFASISDIDYFVTDSNINETQTKSIKNSGVNLITS